MKKSYHYLLLALATAVFMWMGWPPLPFFPFLFIGFVPLLILEDDIFRRNGSAFVLFRYSYLGLLLWNIFTTWWIWNSTAGGAIAAILTNTLIMCIPILLFHKMKRVYGPGMGYFSLITFWTAYDFLHKNWDLTWPWLNIGNGMAKFPSLIQWYEYTGTLGGTIWIWFINILFFLLYKAYSERSPLIPWVARIFAVILIPVAISLVIFFTYEEQGRKVDVVVVQPNVDPYNFKFSRNTLQVQMDSLLSMSRAYATPETEYIVWPETAIPQGIWINQMYSTPAIQQIQGLQREFKNVSIITGMSAYMKYEINDNMPPTARPFRNGECCFDAFNSAAQIDSTQEIEIYHKSKLVPGVEKMPYPMVFKFLEPLAIDLGGISGSLGTQVERTVFFAHDSIGVAPVICYESIFGEYVGNYVNNGANFIFIITNDGWWGNTAGYKQHLSYASLRAIETRRSIARSANTGISCFLDQRGKIYQATDWWKPAVIKAELTLNDEITFYTRYGDYLGRIAVLLSIIFILVSFVYTRIKISYLR